MAKGRKKKGAAGPYQWPPDIFWISPDGKVREVIGHLTSLQAHPEAYGLTHPPVMKDEADDAFAFLFSEGWVRGRYSSGTFSFQMERPRGLPMGNAHAMVLLFEEHTKKVDVDYWLSEFRKYGKDITAREFLEQRFPSSWGLGRKDE